MSITFRREPLTARFLSPDGDESIERHLEVRFDPLLGTSSRIAEGVKLQTSEPDALKSIGGPDPNCPFCAGRIELVTPKISPAIVPEGRIQVGETTLFPNLVPYAQYAAVAVFSPRHWLAPTDFTPALLADNLKAAIDYIGTVFAFDPATAYCAYNVNYLFPSGGSLPHPHAQIFLDPYPTTLLRLYYDAAERYRTQHGTAYWEDLANREERVAERFVGRIGPTAWMTAFAPLGFNELRAVVFDRETVLDLTGEDVHALALGISRVLAWYEAVGYNSFNLVLYSGRLGGHPGFRVNLTMLTRTALVPYYRSDAMYLERLHWEAAVDRAPEAIAADVRPYFR